MGAAIEALRRQRHTGKQIAAEIRCIPNHRQPHSERLGLNRLSALEPAEPVRRYERQKPGELIHVDIKKLSRIGSVGHRITDDKQAQSTAASVSAGSSSTSASTMHSASTSAKVMKDEKKESAVAFLKAAVGRRLLRKPRRQDRAIFVLRTGDRAAKSRARGESPAAQPSSSHLVCGARARPFGPAGIPTGHEARVGGLGLLDPPALLIAMTLDIVRMSRAFLATLGPVPRFQFQITQLSCVQPGFRSEAQRS
jgi:hypothetical protein